jgi:hypothetical protein
MSANATIGDVVIDRTKGLYYDYVFTSIIYSTHGVTSITEKMNLEIALPIVGMIGSRQIVSYLI